MNRTFLLLFASLALPACSTSSTSSSTDAGPSGVQPADEIFVGMRADPAQDLCLPEPLPRGADGLSACKVFVVLAGDAPCSGVSGLSSAPAADEAAFRRETGDAGEPGGSLCALAQLASPCVGASSTGWCYTEGSCVANDAGTCAQAACFSTPFFASVPSGSQMYLALPGDAGP